ncbi:hypothetical protein L6452_36550 [Arctium lappa]|uniref:Uncharacterized protein n=1 Tax=Arctium lappa TaxID=4217 RepID=A0ACB8Y9N2_ARCLA|nr:hypothetical protein L6452_36550 [Arctium lappa]
MGKHSKFSHGRRKEKSSKKLNANVDNTKSSVKNGKHPCQWCSKEFINFYSKIAHENKCQNLACRFWKYNLSFSSKVTALQKRCWKSSA